MNLEKAYRQYSDYVSNDGLCKEHAKSVRMKLYPKKNMETDNDNTTTNSFKFPNLLNRILNIIKKHCHI